MRGFDSLESGLVLVDGAPDLEAPFYPLYNVQQVEVLKGPGAFAWGGGALAGTVQVVRKQPVAARFADVTLAYGRYGTYEAAGDANLASADGKLAFRLNAVGAGHGRLSRRPRRHARRRQPDASSGGRSERARARALVRVREQQPVARLRAAVPERRARRAPSRTTSFQSASDFSEQHVQRRGSTPSAGSTTASCCATSSTSSSLDWQTDGTLLLGAFPFPDGATYVPRTQGLLDDRQQLFGNQLELVASFHTGGVAHQLVTGFEASRLRDTYTQNAQLLQPLDLTNPFEADVSIYPIPLPQASQAGDSRSLVLAPYAIDRMTLLAAARAPGRRALRQRRLRGRGDRARRATPRG